jgi:hypothetical protein
MPNFTARVALHIGTTPEHGTQEQINGSERFPPPGAPARHRAYLIKVRTVLALDLATGGPPSMRLSVFGTGRSQLGHSLFEAGGTTVASPSMTGFGLALWSSGPTTGPT